VRKRLIAPIPQDASSLDEGWLDLDGAAVVEVTSEEKEYPVEAALVQEKCGLACRRFWPQTIRLVFDEPQKLTRMSLIFEETETERPKSSSCDGHRMADARFEKLCVSGGISVPPTQSARSRSITLNSRMSPFSNWSSCRTSVVERLALRLTVCACLDS